MSSCEWLQLIPHVESEVNIEVIQDFIAIEFFYFTNLFLIVLVLYTKLQPLQQK